MQLLKSEVEVKLLMDFYRQSNMIAVYIGFRLSDFFLLKVRPQQQNHNNKITIKVMNFQSAGSKHFAESVFSMPL